MPAWTSYSDGQSSVLMVGGLVVGLASSWLLRHKLRPRILQETRQEVGHIATLVANTTAQCLRAHRRPICQCDVVACSVCGVYANDLAVIARNVMPSELTSDWGISRAAPCLCHRYGICIRCDLLWFLRLSAGCFSICERVVGSEFAFLIASERAEAHHRGDLRVNIHVGVHDLYLG
jgi:hypothetical protein